jgi:predicted alpha/beta hydrolase family esterase
MQLWAIHGGGAFGSREAYLAALKAREVSLEDLKGRDWKNTLSEELGKSFEVYAPRMPNSNSAKYEEWKIWFEKFIPLMSDDVVLLGHSLGGIFLAKYLSTENFPKKIRAVFLVAAPFDTDNEGRGEKLPEFAIYGPLAKLAEQGGEIHLYHSKDDQIVNFGELAKYEAQLPKSKVHVFEDRGHFNQEYFPEIIADIKKVV